MAVKMEFGSSISCLSAYLSSPCQRKAKLKMTSRLGLFDSAEHLRYLGGVKSCKLTYRKLTANKIFSKRQHIFHVVPQDHESFGEIELDDFEDEQQQPSVEYASTADISNHHIERAEGKPGFISFHGLTNRSKDQILVYSLEKNNNHLLWFISPTILVASFIFPSLYLRRLLSTVFEDSLLTDFLILFFTEALFYCGVAIFLFLLDRLWRPMDPLSAVTNRELPPHMGHHISSVTILALSLITPMVTMGFVWPWTGPAASATLAPYLVGIVIQYAFEQYAKYISSPSWPAIPVIFQVYRLHQLNRAAQLVTALSFTVKGAEMTSHNMAMNGSLNTLLNVLHILGMLCIWSLSSFIMRYFLSASTPEQQNTRKLVSTPTKVSNLLENFLVQFAIIQASFVWDTSTGATGVKSCKLTYRKLTANKIFSKRQHIFHVVPQDHESFGEIELDDFEDEQQQPSVEYVSTADISNHHIERAEGKPGFISFHGLTNRSKDQILVYSLEKNNNHLLWFISPTILVASFIFPSLYLRRLLSTVFEDSLLTDFLILFFTEALFYCGVAIFLFLLDRLWRPMDPLSTVTNRELPPHMGHRISSVTILALSLIIPMVTMGFVWPWTGPAASATLAPYLVGIVIQYAFEQYAKYISSPSWPAIPVIFQVYRLHQLNRAAQLVTALSFTVKGAEMTSHNMGMNGSLNTLLNVLHILGMLCIWSLSSFIMRYFLSASTPEQQNPN